MEGEIALTELGEESMAAAAAVSVEDFNMIKQPLGISSTTFTDEVGIAETSFTIENSATSDLTNDLNIVNNNLNVLKTEIGTSLEDLDKAEIDVTNANRFVQNSAKLDKQASTLYQYFDNAGLATDLDEADAAFLADSEATLTPKQTEAVAIQARLKMITSPTIEDAITAADEATKDVLNAYKTGLKETEYATNTSKLIKDSNKAFTKLTEDLNEAQQTYTDALDTATNVEKGTPEYDEAMNKLNDAKTNLTKMTENMDAAVASKGSLTDFFKSTGGKLILYGATAAGIGIYALVTGQSFFGAIGTLLGLAADAIMSLLKDLLIKFADMLVQVLPKLDEALKELIKIPGDLGGAFLSSLGISGATIRAVFYTIGGILLTIFIVYIIAWVVRFYKTGHGANSDEHKQVEHKEPGHIEPKAEKQEPKKEEPKTQEPKTHEPKTQEPEKEKSKKQKPVQVKVGETLLKPDTEVNKYRYWNNYML